jgi:protein-tyrosine phosphatase
LTTNILVVCTGNICRSPMAAALLQHRLAAYEVDATVESAGLVTDGQPASEHACSVLTEMGMDLSTHRSRRVDLDAVMRADLVIGMERAHVREVVTLSPPAFARSFTLKELVRRAERVGPRAGDDPLGDWLAQVHLGRTAASLLGADRDDDVADPYRRPRAAYEQTVSELAVLVDRLVLLAWGSRN